MFQYMYPEVATIPMYCYCMMVNSNMIQPVMPMTTRSMFREEEFEENRMDKGSITPPMQHMPDMGQQMPGMMNMSKMDMEKIKSDTQEIISMFERHHPDLLRTLTDCRMSMGQARQYLSRVVEMALMHHMMHQI